MKWNPFSAKGAAPAVGQGSASGGKKNEDSKEEISGIPGMPDAKDLNMFQRFAMKRLMKMSPAEREQALKKSLTPKNIQKNKAEILSSLEAARKAGQISDDQYRLTKKKLGI